MVGGESRKSKPPTITESKTSFGSRRASPNTRRPSFSIKHGPSSKNTSSKGLASFILRGVLNNATSRDKWVISLPAKTITSSESTRDVIVEKMPSMVV